MTEQVIDEPNRSSDPLRVFLHSEGAERIGTHYYRFYVNLDAHFDSYDIYFQIRKIQCTYSFYQVNESNNKLEFHGHTYEIPTGNYNATEFVDKLNNKGGSQRTWEEKEIFFELDANRGKIFIYSEHEFGWGTKTTAHKLLGFPTLPTERALEFISHNVIDLSPIKVVNFHLVSVPSQSFAVYSGIDITRYLCSLFVGNREPFSVLETDDETSFQETTLQNRVQALEFTLYDQRGLPIDLQNGSFQIMLEFSFRPKKVWRLFYT